MTKKELQQLITRGEDSRLQFKEDIHNVDSLAAEMVAFSNGEGGRLLIGVTNDGHICACSPDDVGRINQLISNAASQHVRSPISPLTENISVGKRQVVIVVTLPRGLDKPYFDRKGVIWLKSGADKRRVNSKEELRRLFQEGDLLHADEIPTHATIKALDTLRFRNFLRDVYQTELPIRTRQIEVLLENMNLAQAGKLNLVLCQH
jgi:ATP-dependent DNA helicase RecG